MEAADLVGMLVPLTFIVMLLVEKWRPARPYPARRGWTWLGLAFLVFTGVVATVLPLALDEHWLAAHRLVDGTPLGVVGGTVVGYTVLSGIGYLVHRAYHTVPLLWRLTHQLHHSPQRVDVSGAALFHPFEMVVQVLLQLFVTVIVLGLEPLAAALVGVIAAFAGIYQHWNVRTPRWTGWFIQRPEAHCLHHERGVHGRNYADFPPWDMLFGSFANPRDFDGACGFDAPADRQLGAMLAWHDVNEPLLGSGSRGAAGQPV